MCAHGVSREATAAITYTRKATRRGATLPRSCILTTTWKASVRVIYSYPLCANLSSRTHARTARVRGNGNVQKGYRKEGKRRIR